MDTTNQGSNGIKPIEIFRPGSFTAMNGQKYTFTEAQVQELADTYRPDFADAPLVVGHPKLTSPRFGRAERLFVNAAGTLCAEAADVVPEFAEAVNNKHYPKVSASIYLPDAPGNPTPGKHYLRHIGFLGGAAPAVKGLKSVEFSEAEVGIADFAFEERVYVRMFRRLRDWFIDKHGMELAENLIPDWELDALTRSEAEGTNTTQPAFSQPNSQQTELELNTQQNAAATAALAQRESDLAGREARIAQQEAKLRLAGHAEFAASLCDSGQLLPASQDAVVQILVQLDGVNQVADFAEGDPNHGKTGAALFKEFLEKQPKQVEFSRLSGGATSAGAGGAADFAAPMGYDVDPAGLEVMQKAQAHMKENPGIGFIDAVKAVATS